MAGAGVGLRVWLQGVGGVWRRPRARGGAGAAWAMASDGRRRQRIQNRHRRQLDQQQQRLRWRRPVRIQLAGQQHRVRRRSRPRLSERQGQWPSARGRPVLQWRHHRLQASSDFYATLRGRLGIAWNQWLLYATGGGIGINTKTSVVDTCFTAPCGARHHQRGRSELPPWVDGRRRRRSRGRRPWSIKAEYLYYDLGSRQLSAPAFFPPSPVPTLHSFGIPRPPATSRASASTIASARMPWWQVLNPSI